MIGLCMYIYIFFREGRIIGRIRLGGAAYIQGLMFGGGVIGRIFLFKIRGI